MQDAPKQPNAADATVLKALVPALVEACPDLYEMATRFARKILTDHTINLDPEQVYFHRFHSSQSNDQTFTGWEHFEHPHNSLTLTQLVITRFSVHDQDNADLLDSDCGFYTAGPEVGTYNQSNEVRLLGSQVMKTFWAFNFLDHYKTTVATFWSSQGEHFRSLAKCTYLAKAIEDREAGRLSDAHFLTVVKAAASNVEWPVTRAMLDASIQPSPTLRIRRLQIGNYVSSDILCIVDAHERQIVYVPGELWGFHVMESVVDLHWWVISQVEKPDARKRFMAHFQAMDHDVMEDTNALTRTQEWLLSAFPAADLLAKVFHEPHMENVGLSHLLDLLFSAWQTNDHQLLKVQQAWVNDDPFTHLRDTTHARMLADAGFMMHTNGELRKKLWMGYLNAFGRVFGPMAAVGWPVALAVVGAGVANVGLNIDQAVTGKTPTERKAGVTGAILAGIDTLFNALFIKGGAGLPDMALAEDTLAADTRLGAGALPDAEAPLLSDIAPERVVPPAQQETLLDSLRTDISEGTRAGTGAREGIIETLSGKTYIYLQHGTTSGYFQVRYVKEVKGWLIIDPQNPYAFSRNVPVRLNAYKQWEPVAAPGLKGGMFRFGLKPWGRATNPLPKVEPVTTAYDVPVAERAALLDEADGIGDRRALSETYYAADRYDRFKALRRRLYNDARNYFAAPSLPDRPPIPTFKPGTSIKEFIQRLLAEGPGIVFGENHFGAGSKRLLIENMPLLAKQKVKTLYLEHVLTDFHQADLDLFNRSGKMSERLERYLNNLDIDFAPDPTGRYTYLEVVKAAQRNHIRVQAIDCMASYRSSGLADVETVYRQQMMNYFARTVIDADQAARGAHKWVALVGDSHTNLHQGVPGLSELEGAVGVRIEDVEVGEPRPIEPDPGKTARDVHMESVEVKNDLRVQMDMPLEVRVGRKLARYLPESGMYMQHIEPGYPMFVGRGRDRVIKCVVIQRDKDGYFVDRPEWSSVNGKRFGTLEQLNQALRARGMVEVPAPRLSPELPSNPVPASYASNLLLEGESLNIQPGQFFQTYSLRPSGNLPNHAILMNGEAYYVRFETQVNGPGHLAIVDPLNPDGFNTSLPVRLNAQSEWELVDSPDLKGGGKTQSKPATSIALPAATAGPSSAVRPQPFSAYDVSPEILADHRARFEVGADGQTTWIFKTESQTSRIRARLLRDAQVFFSNPPPLPARPAVAELTPGLSSEAFIEERLAQAPGLVVGEPAGGIGSKAFLIKYMAAFSKAKVRVLFVKGLVTEDHQALLNAYARSGNLSSELRQGLEAADRVAGNDPSQRFNLLALVQAAQRNDIRVQALDCMASASKYGELPNDGYSRRWVNNFLTHQQISRYIPAGSEERWVALVDPMSTNTYGDLPGISELEGATSLRIEDVPQGHGSGFMVDPGAEAHEPTVGTITLTENNSSVTKVLGPTTAASDVRLQLETPWLHPGEKSLGEQLHAPGLYTLSNNLGALKLIHRSRTAGIVYTPIQTNTYGKFYIQAPNWPAIDQHPFDSVLDLMAALDRQNMTLANWRGPLHADT